MDFQVRVIIIVLVILAAILIMVSSRNNTNEKGELSKTPADQLPPPRNFVEGSGTTTPDAPSNYWGPDWSHHFTGTDGQRYIDSCVRAAPDKEGNPSTVLFSIYQYDPTKPDNLGPVVFKLYTGFAGYTAYRCLSDPSFKQVQWAAFPTGVEEITDDNFMVSFFDTEGKLVWYTAREIMSMTARAKADAGIPHAIVPDWDETIPVWSYEMITSINTRLADIPTAPK